MALHGGSPLSDGVPWLRLLLLRYGTALACVALVILLTQLVEALRERCAFLLFVAAVTVTSWRSGLGAALVATGLSILALDFFFLPPIHSLGIGVADSVNVSAFVLVAVLISWLQTRRQRAERLLLANEEEFRIARQIQQKLFPTTTPELAGLGLAGVCLPANAAAGDYFDYISMPNECLGIALGDVSGHGFGPALLVAEIHAYLHALALTHTDPGQILTLANRIVYEDTEEERFVTVFFACLDSRAQSLVYASAGQEGYLLDGTGKVTKLKSTGLPLGVRMDEVIPSAPLLTLEPDQLVLLVSDGIVEARSPDGSFFGLGHALDIVRANRHQTACQIVEALCQAVLGFTKQVPQGDDLTAVVLKWKE